MPENNDYLSQLMARVNERLNESDASGKPSGPDRSTDDGPIKPHVFTSGGRFDDVPAPEEEVNEVPAETPETETPEKPQETAAETAEEDDYDQEDYTEDYEEDLPQDSEKADEATFSFSPDGDDYSRKDVDGPKDSEDILDWNVSEDVEKYLTSDKTPGGSIFSDIPKEKKSARTKRQEKRRLKANTRQLMDNNSGKRRGCFSAVFHALLTLILIAITILAVLYVLQTIADVTILDVDKIISYVTEKVSSLIQYLAEKFSK
jgi:hypothetical protein